MDDKRLDLNLLVTLETLLQEQNVTKAAERLHLSQPAVSAQLARLRQLFDDQLLLPAKRGMTPTAKAQGLREPLQQALAGVRNTLTSHQHFEPLQAQLSATIACTDYLQSTVGINMIQRLRQQAPNIKLSLCALQPQRLAQQMRDGDVDLALMSPSEAPLALRSKLLFDEDYVLVGRQQHPKLRDNISLADYLQLEHVVVSLNGGELRTPIDQLLAAQGHTRNVVLSVTSFLLVPELLAQSELVALLPRRLVRHRSDLTQVPPPIAATGFSVGMFWHERNHGHNGQRWLRQQISAMAFDQ